MTTVAPILVGRIGNVFWMRVEGKGCLQNSGQAKRCFQTLIEEGTRQFVVDLERCPIMDSTFLGTLTGAALNLRELGDGKVSVVNANARNQQLLRSLGLDHILDVDRDGSSYPAERREVTRDLTCCREESGLAKDEQAGHVLEAHKALTRASSENASRFKDVIEFLEKEVRSQPPPATV